MLIGNDLKLASRLAPKKTQSVIYNEGWRFDFNIQENFYKVLMIIFYPIYSFARWVISMINY